MAGVRYEGEHAWVVRRPNVAELTRCHTCHTCHTPASLLSGTVPLQAGMVRQWGPSDTAALVLAFGPDLTAGIVRGMGPELVGGSEGYVGGGIEGGSPERN